MKKLAKISLMGGCACLIIMASAGITLADIWAMLKSKDEDQLADKLDEFVKETYRMPVAFIFENTKSTCMEDYKN